MSVNQYILYPPRKRFVTRILRQVRAGFGCNLRHTRAPATRWVWKWRLASTPNTVLTRCPVATTEIELHQKVNGCQRAKKHFGALVVKGSEVKEWFPNSKYLNAFRWSYCEPCHMTSIPRDKMSVTLTTVKSDQWNTKSCSKNQKYLFFFTCVRYKGGSSQQQWGGEKDCAFRPPLR